MKVAIVLMASGISKRFGSNKLLEKFRGTDLMELILKKTENPIAGLDVEITRLVLTRTQEVYDYCNSCGVKAILHDFPDRNEAVRLGIDNVSDCDACMFVACDQPLLTRESIEKLIKAYCENKTGIYRLSYKGVPGNPVLFSADFYDELKNLPQKKGGSFIAEKYLGEVQLVEAIDEWELADVDTPEDLIILSKIERN